MKKQVTVIALTVMLLGALLARRDSDQREPRIGVLTPAERHWEGAAFREALRSLGYIEGSNISIDVRSADSKLERMPELGAALINSDVHVIVAVNTPGARAAIEATKTVPIVMTAIGDPVGLGLVTSPARRGAISRGFRT